MLTAEKMIHDVAAALGTSHDSIDPSVPLADQGLDSLRLVTLVENWRAEGYEIDFFTIASLPTLNEWFQTLD